ARTLEDTLDRPPAKPSDNLPLPDERGLVGAIRKIALTIVGIALRSYGEELSEQQEVLTYAADILIDLFAAESAVLRALGAVLDGRPHASLHVDAARVFVNDAAVRADAAARQALAAMLEGDALSKALIALHRGTAHSPINTVVLR